MRDIWAIKWDSHQLCFMHVTYTQDMSYNKMIMILCWTQNSLYLARLSHWLPIFIKNLFLFPVQSASTNVEVLNINVTAQISLRLQKEHCCLMKTSVLSYRFSNMYSASCVPHVIWIIQKQLAEVQHNHMESLNCIALWPTGIPDRTEYCHYFIASLLVKRVFPCSGVFRLWVLWSISWQFSCDWLYIL